MSRQNIGYAAVEGAIQKLNSDGRRITIANVREITGGSNSTIAIHLTKYRNVGELANTMAELPVDMIKALKAGFATMLAEREIELKNKIEQIEVQLKDMQASLESMEESLLKKDSDMLALKNLHKEQIVKLEKDCSRLEAQADAAKNQAKVAEGSLQKATEEKYEFKVQFEVYKAKYDELNKIKK
jgi:chromosome segregation ATPase